MSTKLARQRMQRCQVKLRLALSHGADAEITTQVEVPNIQGAIYEVLEALTPFVKPVEEEEGKDTVKVEEARIAVDTLNKETDKP